jgi:hypothetical protein
MRIFKKSDALKEKHVKGLPPKWLLALDSHIAWGAAIPVIFALSYYVHLYGLAALQLFSLGAVVILSVDLIKEVILDPYFEGEPFFFDGLVDWLEYWAGIGLSLFLLFVLANYIIPFFFKI